LFIIYQILLIIGIIIACPYLLLRAIFGGHGVKERLGIWNFVPDNRKTVWFHAASMGEQKIISTILPELIKLAPDMRIIITTITKTGKAKAEKMPFNIEAFYLPADLVFIVNRVIKKMKPSLFILVETELWPALIKQMHKSGAKIALVNGRISNKSFRYYKFLIPLSSNMLRDIDYIITQTDNDSERFLKLGAAPANVAVYGNAKFDQVLLTNPKPPDKVITDFLTIGKPFVFIAGSVRAGEIKIIVKTAGNISNQIAKYRIVIAPRHMKDLNNLETAMQMASLSYIKRSKFTSQSFKDKSILILDTMGELGGLYRFTDLAFIGGSLVKIGGHDPLEPASSGCAVCFGPYMDNSRLFADILIDSGGAEYVKNSAELTKLILKFAADKTLTKAAGEKAKQAVISHIGVSKKIADKLTDLL